MLSCKKQKEAIYGQQITGRSFKKYLTNELPEEQLYYAKNAAEIN